MHIYKILLNVYKHNLYYKCICWFPYHVEPSSNIVRVIKSRTMEKDRSACRGLDGKLEGKKQLGMPRRRWENNIKLIPK